MSRDDFYSALGYMLTLLRESLLIDQFAPADPRNTPARILRLGIALNAFASLESYVKATFESAVGSLTNAPLSYPDYPIALREFLIVKAVDGIVTRGSRLREPHRKLSFFESEIGRLSKFTEAPPAYSRLGFSPKGSNVDSTDITSAFKAFGVEKVWEKCSHLSSIIGLAQFNPSTAYSDMAKVRHQAAHEAAANIPTTDLVDHIRAALAIGISLDILITQATRRISVVTQRADLSLNIDTTRIKLRFIDEEQSGAFVERADPQGRIIKRYNSLLAAITGVSSRATARFIVVRDTSGRPVRLISPQGTGAI